MNQTDRQHVHKTMYIRVPVYEWVNEQKIVRENVSTSY